MRYIRQDVFIVQYEDRHIAKVFSTEAAAEAYIEKCGEDSGLHIDQWDMEVALPDKH